MPGADRLVKIISLLSFAVLLMQYNAAGEAIDAHTTLIRPGLLAYSGKQAFISFALLHARWHCLSCSCLQIDSHCSA